MTRSRMVLAGAGVFFGSAAIAALVIAAAVCIWLYPEIPDDLLDVEL